MSSSAVAVVLSYVLDMAKELERCGRDKGNRETGGGRGSARSGNPAMSRQVQKRNETPTLLPGCSKTTLDWPVHACTFYCEIMFKSNWHFFSSCKVILRSRTSQCHRSPHRQCTDTNSMTATRRLYHHIRNHNLVRTTNNEIISPSLDVEPCR